MEGRPSNTAHVLLLPYPSQGHLNPLLQFGKRLAYKGLTVTFATTAFIAKSLPTTHVGPVKVETISDGFDGGGFGESESIEAYLHNMGDVGSRTLAELVRRLDRRGQPVTCIVYDAFLTWALEVAKNQLGVHGAPFFTQFGAINVFYYHSYHEKRPTNYISAASSGSIAPSLPGVLAKLDVSDLPSFFSVPGSYPAYLQLVLNQFSNLEKADWVIFNTFYELEPEVMDWMARLWRVKAVGPTVPSKYVDGRPEQDREYGIALWNPDGESCTEWLNTLPRGSVMFVAFGSMVSMDVEQLENVAWALQNCSNHFLWVVTESEEGKLRCCSFKEETKERGLIVRWCTQVEVLAHPAVGCFVSHCGWNSTLEALCLGVPLVGVPQWTDQPMVAKYVEDVWRTGLRAPAKENGIVKGETLLECIKEVMEGERGVEIRRNAIRWKELARRAMDEGGSSDADTEDFVRELVQSSHNKIGERKKSDVFILGTSDTAIS
ncbi:hypothetical protein H6P81_013062 [Aristolochia fimbriata]|uniref:Glycosyltransferase n=1 Tax=Aristolochia fimbriata TaxID=158543 RepID=A0AAV7EF75_ARIFI|nr:hypothetical protein H6P81_013062 [Aristolochia fimbriata]